MVCLEDIDVDSIWRSLNPWGKYQWKQLCSYLFICVSWVIHQLSIVFIGYRPNFRCMAPINASLIGNGSDVIREYGECSIKTYVNTTDGVQLMSETNCLNGWSYDIPKEQSFVTETTYETNVNGIADSTCTAQLWDFVCENAELAELTQTLLIVGMMLGTFIFPSLSDRYGRKPVMVFSHIILFAIVLGTAFSANYYVFIMLRILTGAVSQGALSGTTLALESFPTEVRSYTEVLALAMWTTAICVMSPIAFAMRNLSWRYLQIAYALMSAWSIFQWWMLDESLRWVIANGQIERAKEIIKNACKWNKKDYDTVIAKSGLNFVGEELQTITDNLTAVQTRQINTSNYFETKRTNGENSVPEHEALAVGNPKSELDVKYEKKRTNGETDVPEHETLIEGSPKPVLDVKHYTIIDIVKHPDILKVSIIMWFTWIADSLIYYGLFMISADLYGDRYINFFLSAIIEYPASVYEYFALNRIGRKMTVVSCHAIAALGLILATVLTYTADGDTSMLTAATAFTLIGKMGITGAFSSSYVVTPELYPTNMRNSGLGVCSFMGKVGGMIAPFFRNVSVFAPWLPGAIFAVLALITMVLFAFVPETNGIELPQTIEGLTEWYKVNKFSLKIGKSQHAVLNKKSMK